MSDDELVEKVAEAICRSVIDGNMVGVHTEPSDWRPEAEAALAAVRTHEAGIAAAVEVLCDEWEQSAGDEDASPVEADLYAIHAARLRDFLTGTGAADALKDAHAKAWDEGCQAGSALASHPEAHRLTPINPYREAEEATR